MDFNSFRKEINSKNASVKELVNDIFLKIDSKDSEINSFICTRSLKENLSSFIKDLSNEGSKNIKHTLVRCKKEEPLTV